MNILSNLDMQIINYFYAQFKHIGSIFYLKPWEGGIIYISVIAYIITYPLSTNTNSDTKKRKL